MPGATGIGAGPSARWSKQGEGGVMKRITGPIALALILGSFGLAQGQTLEMAAKCDDASKQLAE